MNQNPDDIRTAGLHRGPNHIDYRETDGFDERPRGGAAGALRGDAGRGADAVLADGAVRGGDFLGGDEFQRRIRGVVFQRG